jgi:flavin reductase (DIM6/NTAB) family NADH-FMN oxidoreductase RutF
MDNVDAKENLKIRLLYGCPVCILTTPKSEAHPYPNAMTLSWLCPVNNQGLFTFSINEKRHTATRLHAAHLASESSGEAAEFVLNIPVQGMEEMVLGIGSCSGAKGDKLERLKIPLCVPGWNPLPGQGEAFSEINPFAGLEDENEDSEVDEQPVRNELKPKASEASNPFAALEDDDAEEEEGEGKEEEAACTLQTAAAGEPKRKRDDAVPTGLRDGKKKRQKGTPDTPAEYSVEHLVAIPACVAHLACRVRDMRAVDGQWLCTAMIERVFVRPEYWSGKVFMPQNDEVPPFMSFVGSQKFGYVQAATANPGTKSS